MFASGVLSSTDYYRVEVSGWDENEMFFVEKSEASTATSSATASTLVPARIPPAPPPDTPPWRPRPSTEEFRSCLNQLAGNNGDAWECIGKKATAGLFPRITTKIGKASRHSLTRRKNQDRSNGHSRIIRDLRIDPRQAHPSRSAPVPRSCDGPQ